MNKKGQEEIIGIVFMVIGIFLFFLLLAYIFSNITVTEVSFRIEDGKINKYSGSVKEVSLSRVSYWFNDNGNKGYYDVLISTDNLNLTSISKTGSDNKQLYFRQFFNCVNISVLDSFTKEFLDSKEFCKED